MTQSTALATISDNAKLFLAVNEKEAQNTGGGSPFPILVLNGEPVMVADTEEQVEIPFANFTIRGTNLFSDTIKFRPILERYIIMKRAGEKDNFKVLGQTVYFSDWNEERLDTFGTKSCGRRFGKEIKDLSDEDKALEKAKANLYTIVWGMVEFPDADPQLVMLRLSGGKMFKWGQATNRKVIGCQPNERMFTFKGVAAAKDPSLSPEDRKKAKGASLIIEPDMSTRLSVNDIAEIGGEVMGHINMHNKMVQEKHIEAAATPWYEDEDSDIIDAEFIEELEDRA